jgi:hypothetical protein
MFMVAILAWWGQCRRSGRCKGFDELDGYLKGYLFTVSDAKGMAE